MITFWIAILFSFTILSTGEQILQEVTVKIESGDVIGQRVLTNEDKVIDRFLSIPYGSPPTGELRFKRPVAVPPWNEPLNVSAFPLACPQIDRQTFSGNFDKQNMGEDCLHLSVYKPVGVTEPSPVLVWIHGGGFVGGKISTRSNLPDNIVGSYGIVTVAIQYRLGALGFLYLDNIEAPGNMGLLDQQLALQWVKKNIYAFGGDSEKITLMGESAGAASTQYHILSPGSENLFSQAILQSGSALSSWAYTERENIITRGKDLIEALSCARETLEDSISCLRDVDPITLCKAEQSLPSQKGSKFTPTNDEYFISQSPKALIDQGLYSKVPILSGVTKHEGDFFLFTFMPNLLQPLPPNIADDYLFMILKGLDDRSPDNVVLEYINLYRQFLLNETGDATNLDILRNIFGDYVINCDLLYSVYNLATYQPNNTYLYVLDHRIKGLDLPVWVGTAHGFDLPLVFGHHFIQGKCLSTKDQLIRDRIITYWTNFIKYGSPNVNGEEPGNLDEWEAVGEGDKKSYLYMKGHGPWTHLTDFHKVLCEL